MVRSSPSRIQSSGRGMLAHARWSPALNCKSFMGRVTPTYPHVSSRLIAGVAVDHGACIRDVPGLVTTSSDVVRRCRSVAAAVSACGRALADCVRRRRMSCNVVGGRATSSDFVRGRRNPRGAIGESPHGGGGRERRVLPRPRRHRCRARPTACRPRAWMLLPKCSRSRPHRPVRRHTGRVMRRGARCRVAGAWWLNETACDVARELGCDDADAM